MTHSAHTPPVRLLHTADWQIGRQYQRFEPEDAAALFEARFTVVERIAQQASQDNVDAVLVAGDVFDAQTVSDRTIRRLFNAMDGFVGHWIMIPGNHDAALVESVWTRAHKLGVLPSNVHLALTPTPIVLDDKRMVVLPAPLTQRHTDVDLTAWFDHAESPDGYFRVGVAHGSVTGILFDDLDATNPIAADRAARARLDYLALGDWHGMRSIDARTWYSGAPETDRFRNNESGHILDITLESPGATPRVQPVRIGQYIWDAAVMDLAVPSDVDQVLQMLQTLTENHVVSLTLTGHVDLAGQNRLNDALGAAQARARALECDMQGLSLHPTDEDIAALHADGYVAEVLQTLRVMQELGQAVRSGDGGSPSAVQLPGTSSGSPLSDKAELYRPDRAPELQQQGRTITPEAQVARDALALLAGIIQQDRP